MEGGRESENQRIRMRIDLEVLNSVDHIMTTSRVNQRMSMRNFGLEFL